MTEHHPRFCSAALNIEGEHYDCDFEQPTPHEIHGNQASGAIWSGPREHVTDDTADCWCEPTVLKVDPPGRDVVEAFERSSFGTPEAKGARDSVTDEQAARVVARAAEMAHRDEWSRCTKTVFGRCNDGRLEPWRGTDGHGGSEWFYTCDRCGSTT